MTRHRDYEKFDNLVDILHHLGDANRTGKNVTWVAKNYSLSQLIKDLQQIEEKQNG